MKITVNQLLPLVLAGMFVYSGCAKQSVVKQDEQLVPATTKAADSAAPKQTAAPAKAEPIASADIKSASLNSSEGDTSGQKSEAATTASLQKAFDKIYFDFDSAALSDTARQTLTRHAALLKQNRKVKIRVEGNCDEKGSDEYNLALGERRAQAAVRYLTTMGIAADRLSSISYGKEKPADPGHDEAAWAKNRRDEFMIVN
jgi:peptidoglycan-associated lipoprotein